MEIKKQKCRNHSLKESKFKKVQKSYTYYYTTLSHTLLKTHIITHTFYSGIMKPGVDVLVGPGCPIDWLRVSTDGTYDFCTFLNLLSFKL